MFKSWRRATANSTAGRVGRGFHSVLSRVAFTAVMVVALVAAPLPSLAAPGGADLQNIPDRVLQAQSEDPIIVSFAQARYDVYEDSTDGAEIRVSLSASSDGTIVIPLTAMQTDVSSRFQNAVPSTLNIVSDTGQTFAMRPTDNTDADGGYRLDIAIDGANLPAGYRLGRPSIATVYLIDDDSPNIRLNNHWVSLTEGNAGTWNVRLTQLPTAPVTVTITGSDSNAATASPSVLTYTTATWNTNQEVTLTGVEDDDFKDEEVRFTHRVTGGDYEAASQTLRVTVTDDDEPALAFSPAGLGIQEGNSGRYQLMLNGRPKETTVVRLTSSNTSVVTVSPGRHTFRTSDWNRPRTVTVRARSDADENDNSATIRHTAEGAEFDGLTGNVPVVVEDDDKPGIKVSANRVSVNEGGTVRWTARLNTRPTTTVTLTVASGDEGAVTVTPAVLTFTTENWNRTQSVQATSVEDADYGDESISVLHTASAGYDVAVQPVIVSVDDDEEAKVLLSKSRLEVGEGSANSYMISLAAAPPGGSLDIALAVSDETLTLEPASVSFTTANWEDGVEITVTAAEEVTTPPATDDTEDNEFTITHTSTDEDFADLDLELPVTVVDNDRPGITVSTGSVTVTEGTSTSPPNGDPATWTVALNEAPTANVVVTIKSSDSRAATVSPSVLTFTTGDFSQAQTVTVTGADDDDIVHERVRFSHTTASDDDDYDDLEGPVVEVTVADTAVTSVILGGVQAPASENDPHTLTISEGTTGSYTLVLSARPTGATVVRFSEDSPAIRLNTDKYTFRTSSGNWNAPRVVLVTARQDENNVNEVITITHVADEGGGFGGETAVLQITVEDDDNPGIKVNRSNLGIDEGESGTISAQLNTNPGGDVTVTVGQSAANEDITLTPTTLTFTTDNWNRSQSVTVTAAEDADISDDTATVQLEVATAPAASDYATLTRDVAVTVNDDDMAGFELSSRSVTVLEGDDDAAGFRIKLTSAPAGDVTFNMTSSDTTKVQNPSPLTFNNSNWNVEQTAQFNVPNETDTDLADDRVTVSIETTATNEADEAFDGLTASATLIIEDDDKPRIVVSAVTQTVHEGTNNTTADSDTDATWTVALNEEPSGPVVVSISTSDRRAATVSPSTLTFTATGVGIFSEPQTVTVTGVEDDDVVAEEVRFRHSAKGGGYDDATERDVEVTVTDNEVAAIESSGLTAVANPEDGAATHTLEVEEGRTAEYTIQLSARPSRTAVVRFPENSPAIRLSHDKHTFRTGEWNRARTIRVSASNDADSVNDVITVTHAVDAGSGFDGVTLVLQITVRDDELPGLELTRTALDIDEGRSGTFQVRLNTEPTADVGVTPGATPADTSVTFTPAGLTFTAANWDDRQTVTVTAGEDDNVVDETVTLQLEVTGTAANYNTAHNRNVTITTDDNDRAGLVVSSRSAVVTEGATATAAFMVSLAAAPTAGVEVAVTSSETDKVTVAPAALNFTSENWDEAQSVSLTAIDETGPADLDDDSATIMLTTADGEGAFNGLTASVAVTIEDDDKPGLTVSRATQTVLEGTSIVALDGEAATWTVVLNAAPTGDVVVSISTSDRRAATASPSTLTFTAAAGDTPWNEPQTVTVTGVQDDDVGDERVRFTHSASGGGYRSASDRRVEVTVTDDEAAEIESSGLAVVDSPATGAATHTLEVEEGRTAEYTIQLSARPTRTTVVRFSEDSRAIRLNTDKHTFRTGEWNRARTIRVTATNDDDDINDVITVTHTADGGGGFDDATLVLQITVIDNELPGLALSRTALDIDEGRTGTFQVRLNTEPTADVTVTPTADPDTTSVTFTPAVMSFTAANWNDRQTVTVTAGEDDNVVDETVTLALGVESTDSDYGNDLNRNVTITTDDNDRAGLVVSSRSAMVTEGDENATAFMVELAAQPTDDVTVRFGSSDTTKVSDPTALTFNTDNWDTPLAVSLSAPQEDTATNDLVDDSVTIFITTEAAAEGNEAFDGLTARVAVAIEDDDKPRMIVSATSQTVLEGTSNTAATGGTAATWTVALNQAPTADVVVSISTSDRRAATVSPSTLTFTTASGGATGWDVARTVTVTGVQDSDVGDESVRFRHSAKGGGFDGATDRDVEVTVTDDEEAEIVSSGLIAVTTNSTLERAGVTHTLQVEEGRSQEYTIQLSGRPTGTTVVRFPENSPAIRLSHDKHTFRTGDWNRARTIRVSASNDDDADDELITVTHTADGGGGFDDATLVVRITVKDDDTAGLALSSTTLGIDEGRTGTVRMRLNTAPNATVALDSSSLPETSSVTYEPETLTFTTANWNRWQTVTFTAGEDDNVVDDLFIVNFDFTTDSASGTNYSAATSRDVYVTTDDNDRAGLVVSRRSAMVIENDTTTAAFMVSLTAAPTGTVAVNFSSSDTTKLGNPGAVNLDADNWNVPQPVNIAAPNESDNDPTALLDENETLSITVSATNDADAPFRGLTASVAVEIEDDDRPRIIVTPMAQTVYEGTDGRTANSSADAVMGVLLNSPPTGNVVVTISSADRRAATASPSVLTFTIANHTSNQSVTLFGVEDDDVADETVAFTLSASGGGYDDVKDRVVEVTVTDDETAEIESGGLAAVADPEEDAATHTLEVEEGSSAEYTIYLSGRPTRTTVVRFSEDSSAIRLNTDKHTFRTGEWNRPRTIRVSASEDDDDTDDVITVTHAADAGGGFDDVTLVLQITVIDDDTDGLSLTRTALGIDEGRTGTFQVRLNTPPDEPVTVTPTSAETTSVTFTPAVLTFTGADWNRRQTVTVSAVEDDNVVDETVTLALVVASEDTGYGNDLNRDVTITTDDNDRAGLVVSSRSAVVTEGETATAAFMVSLTAAPTATVQVTATSSDASVTFEGAPSLSFGPETWDEAQAISLSAADEPDATNDLVDDSATIMLAATTTETADAPFNGLTASVAVTIEDDDKPGLTVSRATQTVFEGGSLTAQASGTQATWTVVLNALPDDDVVVSISTSDRRAATVSPSVLTFTGGASGNWATAQIVTVTGVHDDDIGDERVRFTHSASGGGYRSAADRRVEVTVTDDEVASIVSSGLAPVDGTPEAGAATHTLEVEEGRSAEYTIRLSARPTSTTVVRFSENSPAIRLSHDKHTFRTGEWDRTRTIRVSASQDDDSDDETITVTHAADAGGGFDGATLVLLITVKDDELPGLELERAALDIDEGRTGTFRVRLNTIPNDVVTVTPTDSTNNPSVTFEPASLTFTAANWDDRQTVTVTAAEDDNAADESVTLELAVTGDATGYDNNLNRNVTVTTDDNDRAGLVVSSRSVTVTEGTTATAAFMVSLAAAPTVDFEVAVASSDPKVTVETGATLSFTPANWETPQPVNLEAPEEEGTANDLVDDSATISITAGTQDAAFDGLTASVAVTIEDDDKPGLTVSRATQTVLEGTNTVALNGDAATWTVVLNALPDDDVVVTISTSDRRAATVSPSVLTFTGTASGNWATAQPVTVFGVEDDDIGDETVRFTHSASGGGYRSAADRRVEVTVTDDEEAEIVSTGLAVVNSPAADAATHTLEVEEGRSAEYTIRLSARPTSTTVVRFSENSPAIRLNTDKHTFRTGEWDRTRTIRVSASNDDDSDDEMITVTHAADAGGGFDGATLVLLITVKDNEQPGLELERSALDIDEGRTGTFRVRLNTRPTADVIVTPTDSTNSTSVSFEPASLTFTAANFDDRQTVTVTAVEDDNVVDETVTLALMLSGDDTDYVDSLNRDVTITTDDNDRAGLVVSSRSATVTEGETATGAFMVSLAAAPTENLEVTVASSDTDKVTVGSASLSFTSANWSTPQSVNLSAEDEPDATNDLVDDSATIMLTATTSTAADAPFNGLTASVAVTIEDDDKPGLTVSRATQTVLEGTSIVALNGEAATWTVVLNAVPDDDVVVTIGTSDRRAATVSPSVLTFTGTASGNWATAQIVTVTGVHDDDIGDETVRFTHSASGGGYRSAADRRVEVTVTDDEVASIVSSGLVEVSDATGDEATHTLEVEEGRTAEYTIRLSARPTETTVVRFSENSPAIRLSHDKHTFRTGEWDRTRTIRVSASQDDDSDDETITVTHAADAGGGFGDVTLVLLVTVIDNEQDGLELERTALGIDEGRTGTFRVRLNTRPDADVIVTPTDSTNSTSVTFTPAILTFTATNFDDRQTVTVTAAEDDNVVDETVTLALGVESTDTGYGNDQSRDVTITTDDNDRAGLVVSSRSVTVTEGNTSGVAAFTVALAAQPTEGVTVNFVSSAPLKVENPAALTFDTNNWSTAQSVTLATPDESDASDLADDEVTIAISVAGDEAFAELTSSVRVRVEDNDTAGFNLSAATQTVFEGSSLTAQNGSAATWNVQLNTDPGAGESVTVEIRTSDRRSATVSPTELTFTGGSGGNWNSPRTVTVSGVHDSDLEDETVRFTHEVTSRNYDAADATVTVTVDDDDVAAITLGATEISVDEGSTGSYTIVLDARPSDTTVVRFTAEPSDKVRFNNDKYTFSRDNWDRPRTLEVRARQDEDTDADVVTITHRAEGNGGYAGVVVTTIVTIEDDDIAGLMVSESSLRLEEGETETFTVELNTQPEATVTVTLASEGPGTATVAPPTMTFTRDNWDDRQRATITGVEDVNLATDTTNITITPSGATGYEAEAARTLPVTVTDKDRATLIVTPKTVELTETDADTALTNAFNVKLSGQPSSDVTLTVTSEDPSKVRDDTSPPTTIAVANWNSGKSFDLIPVADMDGDNESVRISISASGAEFEGQTARVDVKVIDDDQPGITVSSTSITLANEAATSQLTVVLNTVPSGSVTVRVSSDDDGAVTVAGPGGTAAGSADLTFNTANWETAQTVTVAAVDDNDVGDESVELKVEVTGGSYNVDDRKVAVSVTDDDVGTMTLTPATLTVDENSSATYTVKLDQQPGGDVTVTLTNSDTTAVSLSATTLTFTSRNWTSAQEVRVSGTNDTDAVNDNATIGHTASGGGFEITQAQEVSVTVTDDDQPALEIDKTTLDVDEGGTGTFRVRLKTEPTGNVTVSVGADPDTKLTVNKPTLTFGTSNWDDYQEVTATGTEDNDEANDETVTLTIASSGGGYDDATDVTLTVTVDDNDSMTYNFTGNRERTLDEGSTETINFDITVTSNQATTFTVALVGGNGATSFDYSADPATVTVAANATSGSFIVEIEDDEDVDPGESVRVSLTPPPGVVGGDFTVVTINITDTDGSGN